MGTERFDGRSRCLYFQVHCLLSDLVSYHHHTQHPFAHQLRVPISIQMPYESLTLTLSFPYHAILFLIQPVATTSYTAFQPMPSMPFSAPLPHTPHLPWLRLPSPALRISTPASVYLPSHPLKSGVIFLKPKADHTHFVYFLRTPLLQKELKGQQSPVRLKALG